MDFNAPDYRKNIAAAEAAAKEGDRAGAINWLRQGSLSRFGSLLWRMPHQDYPSLSTILPAAPPEETQMLWTGAAGQRLLNETFAFVHSIALARNEKGPLNTTDKVLDFGCGYGRILRLMEYYCDAQNLYGCDPWDESLKRCEADRVNGALKLSDYVPEDLPFGSVSFDFVYAFSVFTHLSEKTMVACLKAIRRSVKSDALLAITIRPEVFWNAVTHLGSAGNTEMIARHKAEGFAFLPHVNMTPIDGDVPYGDTSMTLEFLQSRAPGWEIRGTSWNAVDPYQTIVFLTPT